jgi:hypothetical protein
VTAGTGLAFCVSATHNWNVWVNTSLPSPTASTVLTANASSVPTWVALTTFGQVGVVNTWTAPQKTSTETPAISTATFTPLFNTTASAAQNHRIVLVHASCPCTLANPASLGAGQSGMFEIVQSSTGSDTIGTWGTDYEYAGGTASITLSTTANAVDYIPYIVDSTGSFVVLGGIIKGPVH